MRGTYSKPIIVVPDAGLREYGGHHPATLQSVLNSRAFQQQKFRLDIFTHQDCSEDFLKTTEKSEVKITKYFTTDFYQYFHQSPGIGEIQCYISRLAKEYKQLILTYNEKAKHRPVLFWFHTLNWQHSYALALALDAISLHTTIAISIAVGLMYSPNKCSVLTEREQLHSLYVHVALNYLKRFDCVTLFATDAELVEGYEALLKTPVGIQPCTLIGDSDTSRVTNKAQKESKVILFTGDAKLNKGFLQLPEVVETVLSDERLQQKTFVVQYTITNDQPELANVASQLRVLKEKYPNLEIIDAFQSHQALQQLFISSDMIVFNYDEQTYKQQSSGVLWLAAYYGVVAISLTSTWIGREARRLDVSHEQAALDVLGSTLLKKFDDGSTSQEAVGRTANNYYQALFKDLGCWLYALVNRKSNFKHHEFND